MKLQENDLVLIRINTSFRAWIRIQFIDLDNTFIGKIELVDKDCTHKIGETLNIHISEIIEKVNDNDGKDWCYSDRLRRCDCPGLCREK